MASAAPLAAPTARGRRPDYWIGGEYPTGVPDNGTDFDALHDGYVSVMPLQLDLTNYPLAERMKGWEWIED